MRNVRADVFCYFIVAQLFLAPFSYAAGNEMAIFKSCDIQDLKEECGLHQRCFQSSKDAESRCRCELGYELQGKECIQIVTTTVANVTTDHLDVQVNSRGSSVAAGLLIPTFLIVLIVVLYFVARRYKWLQRVRQLRPNHYGNVLVTRDDDDDDDPPIAI